MSENNKVVQGNKVLSFPRWLAIVRRAHFSAGFKRPLKLHAASWKILYDEGLSPTKAVIEDMGCRAFHYSEIVNPQFNTQKQTS